MRSTIHLGVLVAALLACKMFKKEEPTPALPPPEPTPTATTAEPTPTVEPAASGATPTPTPTPTTVSTKKTDAGAKDASAPADAGGGKSAACASKCQGVLQACLLPGTTEGGLPKFADPTQCQAAFDECAKACK